MHRLFKNITSIALSLAIALAYAVPCVSVQAESVQLINTLVVFAQFEDLQDYNYMETHTDDIVSMCNDTTTLKSLKSYISTISYGKAETQCYFPQLQDGTIVPYQLQQSKEDYSNSEAVALEVLSNVEVPSDIDLDGNNDGIVDNIILVIDGKAQSGNDILWPCAFYLSGLKIGNLYTGYVNIQNSYSLFENTITGGVGVLCHEFLHSLDYPDLYRNSSRDGTSVGLWDIMCSDSVFLQYPLAYQRATISHWLDETPITTSGTYTIECVSQSSGNRLYTLKTPLSDTELFAIEYRQKGSSYAPYEMDSKVYGSGLVIYRVNTEVSGNHKTDSDGIYVFRPDETTVDSGLGDIYHSNYGGEGSPTEIGSTNLLDGIEQNALVYSDGTNSGIKISNITLNGDTATFEVEFADTSTAELWQTAYSSTESVSSLGMATLNDTPYIVTSNGSNAVVSYLNGDSWETLGNSIGSGEYSSVNDAKLVVCNNIPYVLYNDRDYKLKLYAYDPTTNTWNLKYSSSELSQYTDITAYGDSIYIAYTVGSYPYALNVLQYNTTSGEITTLGENLCDNACNVSIACTSSELVVSYRNLSDSSTPTVATYSNGIWDTSKLSSGACSMVTSTSNGESTLVATTGTTSGLYLLNSGNVTELSLPTDLEGSIFSIEPLLLQDDIYLAINTQNSSDFSIYHLAGNSWEKLGNSLSKEYINFPSVTYANKSLYVGYVSTFGTLTLKAYTVASSKDITIGESQTLGDINLDGSINYLDLLMLKKHILDITSLNETQYPLADICKDGYINILDFLALKNLVL